ncbi:MAG: Wzz/FepE/Etk N-terminal domain-containing protein [Acidimicrobiales bacterium]
MKRYLEMFFRHRLLVILPLLVAVTGAVMYASSQHRQYQSTASLWVDSPVPGNSTIIQGVGAESPATSQMNVLNELLQTHDFLLNVAKATPLARFVATHPPAVVNSTLAGLVKGITVGSPGPQVINVTVKAASPGLAVALDGAVVHQYTTQVFAELQSRASTSVSYDGQQVKVAQAALAQAISQFQTAVGTPQAPGAPTALSDTTLTNAVLSAQEQLNTAQQNYQQANIVLGDVSDPNVLRVSDEPSPAVPLARKKQLIFTGIGGLLGGLVVSIVVLMVLTAADTSARDEGDIERALDLRVVGNINEARRRRWARKPA